MTVHDLILVVAVAFSAFVGARAASSGKSDEERLARLEKKLDMLLSQSGLEADAYLPGPAWDAPNAPSASISMTGTAASADVVDLVRRGRKIEAIKLYRELNPGMDLKQAKDAVEQIERPPN